MIYASTMVYALGRALGHERAIARVRELAAVGDDEISPVRMGEPEVPAARVLGRLRELDDVTQHIDAGATCIGKARSRAMDGALQSKADVWVSVDDDVEADVDTLNALVTMARHSRGICLAPCLLRRDDRQIVNVHLEAGPFRAGGEFSGLAIDDEQIRTAPATWGGFGLVALHRQALECVSVECVTEGDIFTDDDGLTKVAAFHELIVDGEWFGEDRSFFEHLEHDDVPVNVLLVGSTTHAGRRLECRDTLTMDRFDTPGVRLTLGA